MSDRQCDRLIGHAWLIASMFVPYPWIGLALALGGVSFLVRAARIP